MQNVFFGDLSSIEIICNDLSEKVNYLASVIENSEHNISSINVNIEKLLQERNQMSVELSNIRKFHYEIMKKLDEISIQRKPILNNEDHVPMDDVEIVEEPVKQSFSDIVKEASAGKKSEPRKAQSQMKRKTDHVVIVKPKNQDQKNDATFSDIRKKIDASGRNIQRIRNVAKGGILIECETKDESISLQNDAKSNLGDNYVVSIPDKSLPKIRAFGLHENLLPNQIEDSLRDKNQNIIDDSSHIKVVHTFGSKSESPIYGFKLETDPNTFQKILAAGRLRVLWETCSASECVDVRRCYNCCGFYHTAKECSAKMCCSTCGGEHKPSECNSTDFSCVNCLMANQRFDSKFDTNHKASSLDCMVYKRQLEIQRRRVNYGSSDSVI